MADFPRTHMPPTDFGSTSLIVGAVGLILFVFPILSIPLSCLGLVFGLLGALMAVFGRGTSLRWPLAGIALSGLTLVLSVAMAQTASGYLSIPPRPSAGQQVSDQPFVSPPAHAHQKQSHSEN